MANTGAVPDRCFTGRSVGLPGLVYHLQVFREVNIKGEASASSFLIPGPGVEK